MGGGRVLVGVDLCLGLVLDPVFHLLWGESLVLVGLYLLDSVDFD